MLVPDLALLLTALSLAAAMARVVRGPSDADRVLAVDFGFVAVIAAVALLALRLDTHALADLVLVATLLGFVTTVALARRLEQESR